MNTELIFEKSRPGQNRYMLPRFNADADCIIPDEFLRESIDLPDCSEPEVVRHFNNLSRMNFGVDNGMYPLGSCTMKYNPKINERIARGKGFTAAHPLSKTGSVQGNLHLMYELKEWLCALTGMADFTLSPAAGSHGELTGVMIIKRYFESIGEQRDTILIPDSAHGTNPASVAMCGFMVREVPSRPDGDIDIEKLKEILDNKVAAMMLTSPNTLGLFDRNTSYIAELLHQNGSLFYGDGANLNATIGRMKFRDIGFDLMHINLHKTFSTPHGGGGPGAGPLGVSERLAPYLPVPVIVKKRSVYYLDYNMPESIGRIHSFYGNFAVLLRAWCYIKMLGYSGIRNISGAAVLNANYLMTRLADLYNIPVKRRCMHEFVINDKGLPDGITTNDIGKRILDYGFHSPTVYFPLIIPGAMMIEPVETETLMTLDRFIDVMKKIREECDSNPELVKSAPHNTPAKRVDTVLAARIPVLVWGDEKIAKA